jgi:hypothetical protein
LRTKEQETRLILHEHDDDDELRRPEWAGHMNDDGTISISEKTSWEKKSRKTKIKVVRPYRE